jgi:hypothetical protein
MYFSTIRTSGGSGIDILVPAGDINAGLPTPQSQDIGVVTTLGGEIRTYLSGSFNVNQSKVITLQGGDILLYSRFGNIDAGRGARDSLITQPPRRVIQNGVPVFLPPVEASGSGIRTLTSDPDGPGPLVAPKAGDVFLFAPAGFVDAGEAGVVSAGNIIVAAAQVLNAGNFSAGGASVGVPQAPATTLAASLSGASNSSSGATRAAEAAAQAAASSAAQSFSQTQTPSFITVEVIGLGEEGESPGK